MVDLVALRQRNCERWAKAQLTRAPEFNNPAHKAVANKQTYLDVVRRAGMPDIAWVFVAVSHYREASQDFTRNLGQGDPLDQVSIHVPKGRGPFFGPDAFVNAAVDALKNCAPYAARETDWSIAGMLTLLERYNGTGYAARGLASPYVWSGTNQYVRGKYVADGLFDPSVVDKQLGCAGLIMRMMQIDPTITFTGTTLSPRPPPKPAPSPKAPLPQPRSASQPPVWAAFLSAILAFFKRKS
jgi:lysozyme family protein